jgi:hypothetical protein
VSQQETQRKEKDETMIEVTVTVSGVNYSAVIGDGQERSDGAPMVSISRNGVWAGAGWWGGQRIEDCAADLGGEAYVAIDAAIVKAFDSDVETERDGVETERDGVALDLPAYVSDAERARIETGRPTWAAKLIEIDAA